MGNKIGWRVLIVLAVTVWGLVYILPNFTDVSKLKYFPGKKVVYGLDIQGGIHLVLGVDIKGVVTEHTKRLFTTITENLSKQNVKIVSVDSKPTSNNVDITLNFENDNQGFEAKRIIEKDYSNLVVMSQTGTSMFLKYNEVYINDLKKRTLEQAIETIRNRIDEFGVAEPSISAQGEDRILVQLPGIEDSSRAKELINKTARLEFLVVDAKADFAQLDGWIQEAEKKGNYSITTLKYSEYVKKINEDLAGKLPKDTKVIFEKLENVETMASGKRPYIVNSLASITGDDLKNAQITYSERGEPQVAMSFNPLGSKKFADLTGANVGGLIAIVLDDVIYAAPRVNERIGGGEAVISLGTRNYEAAMNEAGMISMALRAGALPAKLEQLEERTVGPSLGQDSIKKAEKAVIVGMTLLLLFMLFYYKTFGVFANLALILNAVLILAVLSSFNATLTLPGVAGIALTIGMAVDANVIIYERIREELKRGLSMEAALREGYDKAFSAILDSNLTTIATSVILMYYGTGPVRGFAVTLVIGLITSMFTAIFFTKTIAEVLVYKLKVKKLYI